jgi:hypothetical protein
MGIILKLVKQTNKYKKTGAAAPVLHPVRQDAQLIEQLHRPIEPKC